MHPTSRRSAIALCKTVYYTGKPCPKGHYSVRYTINASCKECVVEARSTQQAMIQHRFKSLASGGR